MFEPEYLQKILGSKRHTEKSFFYKLLHNFLGKGLITNSGEKWASHRRYIQPAFRNCILEKFVETFSDSAQCLQDKLMRAPDVMNITEFINDCVLDVLNGEIFVFDGYFYRLRNIVESLFEKLCKLKLRIF